MKIQDIIEKYQNNTKIKGMYLRSKQDNKACVEFFDRETWPNTLSSVKNVSCKHRIVEFAGDTIVEVTVLQIK